MKTNIGLYLALLFGVFSLSTSAIFVRLANAPSAITAFFRLFFAALILLPFLLSSKQNKRQLLSLSKKQWTFGILSGLLLSAHYMLWFESLRHTSVASSTVIVTLQPLFSIAIGYVFLKERFHKLAIGGCVIAIMGCFMIGWGDFQISSQALFGDLLALLAAGIISLYFFIGQAVRKELSAVPYSVISYLSSSAFLGCYAIIEGNPFTGYSGATWMAFGGLALISTVFGQFIFNWLLKWIPATVISMSILGETIGTCILAYFILNEAISLQQSIGIATIMSGLVLFFLSPPIHRNQ
ncbi:MAG: DMT family transporter [Lacrimispora celerecrescens]|uniref:DMT family transporter n=1 Tax=Lacrimispora indolis TaxID=69825 RepID=UPI00041D0310|nr:DMT family transporter [[Clostridium] methoxybenzovorans]MBE7722085.1 DMT family transporter [Lacrimispora celerecrescens]